MDIRGSCSICGRCTNWYTWRELYELYSLTDQGMAASNFRPRFNRVSARPGTPSQAEIFAEPSDLMHPRVQDGDDTDVAV